MKYPISHPMASRISVVTKKEIPIAYANTSGTLVEIAFFDNKGKWINDILPEFAEYAETIYTLGDAGPQDTRVYGYVPNELVEKFLEKYSV